MVDQLMIDLDENKELQDWLCNFADEQIENENKFNIIQSIKDLGNEVFKENFYSRAEKLRSLLKNKELAAKKMQEIKQIAVGFELKLKQITQQALLLIERHNLSVLDFAYGKAGFATVFTKFSDGTFEKPSKRFYAAINDVEKWYSKKSDKKDEIQSIYNAGLNNMMQSIVNIFEEEGKQYYTAVIILKYRYTLPILADLTDKLLRYCGKENIFLLSNSNILVNEIIKENDSPFIYEKIGTRLKNFMIDEFQDTSLLQWQNFKPLVENSLAEGNMSVLVGDVKQSIYRWRNGDWKLLGETIPDEFINNIDSKNLDTNWRSSRRVIEFNNRFFQLAAQHVQNTFDALIEEDNTELSDLYKDRILNAYKGNIQNIPENNKSRGYVQVQSIPDDAKSQDILEMLPPLIEDAQMRGYKPSDIVFLVRKNSQATELVNFFLDYKASSAAKEGISYNVFSSESVLLNSSSAVRFIISILQLRVDYNNDIAKAYIKFYINTLREKEIDSEVFSLTDFDQIWNSLLSKIIYDSSIYALVEQIIFTFKLSDIALEIPFLFALQEAINSFEVVNGADLVHFLAIWEEQKNKKYISIAANETDMNVLTIHKSKGLEYKIVIIPFVSNSHRNDGILWCSTTIEPFNSFEILPVKNQKLLKETIYQKEYFEELFLSYVDELNIYYVAFTRAADELYLLVPKLKEKSESLQILPSIFSSNSFISNESNLMDKDSWVENGSNLQYGQPSICQHSQKQAESFDTARYQITLPKSSIFPHSRNSNFFDDFAENGTRKSYGILMHKILEKIIQKEDIEKTLYQFYLDGVISRKEITSLSGMLLERIEKEPFLAWFNGTYKVLTEQTILVPKSSTKRPDRIMIKENKAVIVDYKFTKSKDPEHLLQMQEYKYLLSEIGYETDAILWYFETGETIAV
ncbi:MAG: UvrD-helicase domain-containing protein [Bacteroidales bacterium]|nr:UvrD-helicase domain-containing protein [Bacteroidales bacterium]